MNLYTMTGNTVHREAYAGSTRPLCREVTNGSKRFIPTDFKAVTCKSCLKKIAKQEVVTKVETPTPPAPEFERITGPDGYTYRRMIGGAHWFRVAPRRK